MNSQIDSLDAIKKLGELKELGLVTEEEFQEKKSLIFLKEKHEILAVTGDFGGISADAVGQSSVEKSTVSQSEGGSANRLKKRVGQEGKAAVSEASSLNKPEKRLESEPQKSKVSAGVVSSSHRLKKRRKSEGQKDTPTANVVSSPQRVKKRRKIEKIEGTTTPASSPDKQRNKNGYFSPLFVSLGILLAVCFGSALWLF